LETLNNKRVATAYPGLLRQYFETHNVIASITPLDGAVESSVALGVADYIADVVSTGGTLRSAGLKAFGEPILTSEAIVISRTGSVESNKSLQILLRRLNGVVIARQYVLVDYDIESKYIDSAIALTPGIESPTISDLAKDGWKAVRAMVKKRDINALMDSLYDLGARGILVTDIHACRL
jgi:ATP phosphoribosyltransferase